MYWLVEGLLDYLKNRLKHLNYLLTLRYLLLFPPTDGGHHLPLQHFRQGTFVEDEDSLHGWRDDDSELEEEVAKPSRAHRRSYVLDRLLDRGAGDGRQRFNFSSALRYVEPLYSVILIPHSISR